MRKLRRLITCWLMEAALKLHDDNDMYRSELKDCLAWMRKMYKANKWIGNK